MGIFSYWRDKKARKAREKLLKETPHMERIWLFTKQEFVEYCDNNNAYVFCIARAVDILLGTQTEGVSYNRIQFNTKVAKSFTNMVSHSSNQVRVPLKMGNDPRYMNPHPLERGRINTRVYEGLQAMKEILSGNCSDAIAESIASRYIIDPYEEGNKKDGDVA